MCRGDDPLFLGQSALPSLPIHHQCAVYMPPLLIIRKILHFWPCFWAKLQFSRCKFSKFLFPGPLIFQGKSAPQTLLLETVTPCHPSLIFTSIGSPICQERQSEKNFPDFYLFFLIFSLFPNFPPFAQIFLLVYPFPFSPNFQQIIFAVKRGYSAPHLSAGYSTCSLKF